jgi:hypothetical protein
VEIGNRLRQRVTVLTGAVHPECRSWLEATGRNTVPIAVPSGHWILIGAEPGESESVMAPVEGALIRPTFQAVWAVRVGAGPGATALHVHDPGIDIGARRTPTNERGASWPDTIYQAGIRRPNLLCPFGCPREPLRAQWHQLMETARSIKRARRRRT